MSGGKKEGGICVSASPYSSGGTSWGLPVSSSSSFLADFGVGMEGKKKKKIGKQEERSMESAPLHSAILFATLRKGGERGAESAFSVFDLEGSAQAPLAKRPRAVG